MAQHLRTEPVHRNSWRARAVACLVAVVLAACGGGDPTTTSPPEAMQPTTVTGDDGASVDFTPAEGLAEAALSIARAETGAPDLPPGMQAAGAVYQFAPMGHVGSAIEIRVPFDGGQASGAPRLLVALAGEDSWSEVDARLEGTMLRARVPALGYAVAARPQSPAGATRLSTSASVPAPYLRGQLSAEPALQGGGFLLTATAPSTATMRLDYSFAQSCAAPVQLRLRALVARSPSSTLPFAVRTVDLGSRALTARAGSETFELPLTAANNGTWIFLADARCIEQGRVRFGVLTALPVLVVKIVNMPPPPPAEGSATIGSAGGFVTGPDGVRLAVPPAALESDITFRIARESSGAPPLPAGIDLASAVYAITPHGQPFAVSTSVELPVSAALAAGRPTFLMKADPGGRWSVIASDNGAATTLRAGIDSLSYLAVGVCQNNLPAGSLFAQACPSSNQLGLELLLNGSTPVPISQDTTYGAPIPVVLVTSPETLTFRMTWTRPAGTNRVDILDTGTGLSSSTVVRQAGFTFATVAPRSLQVNENSFSRTFTVDVDPARVSGATGPNGVVRRIWAQAAFAVTGPGNVGSANWEFNAWVPIQVRSLAPLPVIDTQPANVGVTEGQPAGFTVAASIAPAATLNYQWARRTGAGFTPIPGATLPSYSIPAAQLADNGAQFQVEVCAARCVTSNVATLSVTQAQVAPSFTVQPSDIAVLSGQTASFSATASGTPPPRIEWQSAPASDPNNFTNVAGASGCTRTDPPVNGTIAVATCTVGPLAVGDSGRRYRAAATNSSTTTNSTVATVTVNAVPVAPSITQQPQPQTATAGGSATFSVTATGTATLGYQWRLNGTPLPSVSAQFNTGTCTGFVTYSNLDATITLSNIVAGCHGTMVSVTVSNGINPSAASNGVTLTVNPATPTLSLLAGALGVQGNSDGTGSAARFNLAFGVTLDDAGNAYVADPGVGIRRITPAGDVTTLTATRGYSVRSIARDPTGGFVLASFNAVWRMTAGGAVTLLAGDPTWSEYVDAPVGTDARFIGIGNLAVDGAGNVFVTETGNGNATIRRITPNGEVTTWAGAKDAPSEVLDGDRLSARFGSLVGGLAFDVNGNLYVADLVTVPPSAFVIRRINPQGDVTSVAGNGAALARATCLAFEPSGSLLAAGVGTLQRIGTDGSVTTLIGAPAVLGVQLGASPQLNTIFGLALRPNGRLVLTSERAVLELTLP